MYKYMALQRSKFVRGQEGQILLIVVLTMIVALTVGLSIAARIVTELKLSKQNEESQRAFQAAEAGIQQTLKGQSSINVPISLGNNASFSTTYLAENGTEIIMNNGQAVDQAIGGDVWLSDYSSDPALIFKNPMGNGKAVSINIYWGAQNQNSCASSGGDSVAPAIEVVLLSGTAANPIIQKSVYESNGCTRIANATAGITAGAPYTLKGGVKFYNYAPLTFNGSALSNGLVMKVIPIFNSSIVGFQAQDTAPDPADPYPFPAQGSVVSSTGTSGDTVRKVVYYQSFPQLPLEIFPYSLLSQ